MDDPYRLERFVDAQNHRDAYLRAVSELRAGRKTGHWMWFIFPQMAGLGRSSNANFYAISSLDEAKAYVAHPVLGPRLLEITQVVNQIEGRSAAEVFGGLDAMKLRSSMTLFAAAAPETREFTACLDRYFDGQPDPLTIGLLRSSPA
ncbi:DUF1810 domain-containing protein [Geodermatophilus sp. SYSU D00779]